MKNITVLATGAVAVVAVSSALTACTPTTEQAYTGPSVPPPTVWTGSPAPAHEGGHGEAGAEAPAVGKTLNQYILDNKIAETPFKKDDPGTPKVEFPLPPGWTPAGDLTPDWAYGAIYYGDQVKPLDDATYMYAIAAKLTGDVDPQKILEFAPGQLNELPGFTPTRGGPERDKFAGYDAINYVGTYQSNGKTRAVGQETIVIPAKDGLFVFQLNGEAPEGQEQAVVDAADVIRSQTKITLPS